ncbi:hypothetical protein ACSHWB_41395 [Lentzea sp. HUAS TT2]|uniref:hypothetical protein n=1 Tax=Lentzea sp. HUAS TT2 TaxID=3447454 RepID=UPI003F70373B
MASSSSGVLCWERITAACAARGRSANSASDISAGSGSTVPVTQICCRVSRQWNVAAASVGGGERHRERLPHLAPHRQAEPLAEQCERVVTTPGVFAGATVFNLLVGLALASVLFANFNGGQMRVITPCRPGRGVVKWCEAWPGKGLGMVDTAPRGWVPVEHRFLGLDRRTFAPALSVLAIALLLLYGLPALNAVIPWHNEIRAGDVLDLGDGATAVPPVGWQLEDGVLAGTGSANPTSLQVQLAAGGASIVLRGTPFTGSAEAFLDQVQRAEGSPPGVDGSRGTVTTASGLVGVAQGSTSPNGDGLDVAFKMTTASGEAAAAPALLVRVRTAPGQFERLQDTVGTFLRSITAGAAR